MYDKNSRIFFKDNPFPNGHRLKEFSWTAKLDPNKGIWFQLHLETDSYNAEDKTDDPEGFEPESDWKAKIVWNNYRSCKISSTYWHNGGFLAGSTQTKLDFLSPRLSFHVDQLPRPDDFDIDEDPVCCIYLLGHDDCADHKITFTKNDRGTHDIEWAGKIALAYSGDYDFKYAFNVRINDVEFGGLICPSNMSDAELNKCLANFSINFEAIRLIKN